MFFLVISSLCKLRDVDSAMEVPSPVPRLAKTMVLGYKNLQNWVILWTFGQFCWFLYSSTMARKYRVGIPFNPIQ